MAFVTPTEAELRERIAADIELLLDGSDPYLKGTPEWAFTRLLARAFRSEHDYLDWLSRQFFPDICEEEFLLRWAAMFGISRKAAAAATGDVTFTGTDTSVIAAGTEVQRSDGALYTTDAEATITGGSATVAVTASQAGAAGDLDAGATVELVNPVAGVNSSATVAAGGITGGTDQEDLELWRGRILQRIRETPASGNAADYERWTLEVAGVTNAWVYPLNRGLGTVDVTFIIEGTGSAKIPNGAKVAEVQAYLDPLYPVTADVVVFAPVALTVDITIQISPNTAAVQAAITAELEDLLDRRARPGDGAGAGTIYLSQINEAISLATGEEDHIITVMDGGSPADIVPALGEYPVWGTITYQAIP